MTNREITTLNQWLKQDFDRSRTLRRVSLTASVGVFIGLLAPFGMHELPAWLSISYWVFTCLVGYSIYLPIISVTEFLLRHAIEPRWIKVAIGAFIASIVMSFVVPITVWLFFGMPILLFERFVSIFPKTLLIGGAAVIVSFFRERMEAQKQILTEIEQEQATLPEKVLNDFMLNLPVEKRGELYCLEMDDHYVKVYTDKGTHLVLMRFKDAMQALESFPGIQTHRSWWVAHEAVVKVNKEQRKLNLVLQNELTVPVSRTFSEQVKAAGFTAK